VFYTLHMEDPSTPGSAEPRSGVVPGLDLSGYATTPAVPLRNPDKGLPSWAHPVISEGRLYVRNQDILKVYDIKSSITP
jgi:hypothetical protein